MSSCQVFEQSIQISASATTVERCITDLELMHRWLNPALLCEPIGEWSTDLGGRSRFLLQIPVIKPALKSTVIEREPGLIVWQFEGFFKGEIAGNVNPTIEEPISSTVLSLPSPTRLLAGDLISLPLNGQDRT